MTSKNEYITVEFLKRWIDRNTILHKSVRTIAKEEILFEQIEMIDIQSLIGFLRYIVPANLDKPED